MENILSLIFTIITKIVQYLFIIIVYYTRETYQADLSETSRNTYKFSSWFEYNSTVVFSNTSYSLRFGISKQIANRLSS